MGLTADPIIFSWHSCAVVVILVCHGGASMASFGAMVTYLWTLCGVRGRHRGHFWCHDGVVMVPDDVTVTLLWCHHGVAAVGLGRHHDTLAVSQSDHYDTTVTS
jgi:hypothetical protein